MPEPTEFDEKSVDLSKLDLSDLKKKYHVSPPVNFLDKFIVCDGTPVAPESKALILKKVLFKLFSSCGKVVRLDVPVKDGKTSGYVFVEFQEPQMAAQAIKRLNGRKLDVRHRLLINKITDIEKYVLSGKVKDEFKGPKIPEYKSHGFLRSYLQDPAGRDQYMLHSKDTVGLYWFKKNLQPEPVIDPRSQWTSGFMKWSPSGKYLFSLFPNGVQCWGGPKFDRISRFYHPSVALIDCSPNEKYLVTLSPQPIAMPAKDDPNRATFPFKPESVGHKLVIWDIETGLAVKTFALPPNLENRPNMPWPLIKWSFDSKYCARMGPNAIAVYDVEKSFSLLDKKLVKIPGVMGFEFAPGGVKLAANRRNAPPEVILSYWSPEEGNRSAKVAVMQIPSRDVLRTINLVQVTDCQMHWQAQGKYMCCCVNRHTKSKKTMFTNLQIFQLEERDIPVETIDLHDLVITMAWEPTGKRFCTISMTGQAGASMALATSTVTFYDTEKQPKTKNVLVPIKRWIAFDTEQDRMANYISFSPKGRFVAIATMATAKGAIKFYDLSFEGDKPKTQSKKVASNAKLLNSWDYPGVTNLEWDNSGRFLAAWSSSWKQKIENGYKIYDSIGRVLSAESVDEFKEFQWRPRPKSLLSNSEKKKVRKNLREYSAQFEEQDAMEANAELRDQILERKKLLQEWQSWRKNVIQRLESLHLEEHHDSGKEEVIEEVKEVVIEEKEEVIQ